MGAVLPGGDTIRRQKLKGVASNGMLCSAGELNLSDDHEGIMILNDYDGATPGRRLTDVLSIEPDAVFDIAVEANRPDALSVAGVARDLAARLGLPFAFPVVPTVEGRRGLAVEDLATVEVADRELCPRFNARVVTEVAAGSLARLVGSTAVVGRHAAHQQRGRRVQLRDAGARPAHPPLRPRPSGR